MHVTCSQCHEKLEFTSVQPKFCSSCGQILTATQPVATALDIEAPTLPPRESAGSETVTLDTPTAFPCDEIPQTVGPYQLVRRLGQGGMGSVYEAEDTSTGMHVALKLVQPEHAASKEAINRFRQEGELASRLTHPRCVFVLAADEDKGRPYIVMELMTGSTLQDLVKEKGPLPQELALSKILDVIEGLSEAHQLGLVHRDVKPSNCFLEANGRVKIGDFGLAKSLVREAHLTRTGTFLGTPLFAAPEQIKMEVVDAQSDVYSVAATLYFLLTGRAPFQTNDPIASMARIVADDPPSMRTLRRELPRGLDKVVLRGLERDRKRRWRTLEDFQRALMPFLPAEPSVGGLWFRLGAYLLDVFLLSLVGRVANLIILLIMVLSFQFIVVRDIIGIAINLSYFGIFEGIWGCTPGKRLLRLRVGAVNSNRPPGFTRAVARAGVLAACLSLGAIIAEMLLMIVAPEVFDFQSGSANVNYDSKSTPPLKVSLIVAGMGLSFWFGLAGIISTMRKRNGYRGLHEILSGTRTYRLHWPRLKKRQALDTPEFHLEVERRAELPEQIGPYKIRGAISCSAQEELLLGDDTQLGRSVWIWVQPTGAPPLSEVRRGINRTTRVRWIASGTTDGHPWDAFLAPTGCPLGALVAGSGRLRWSQFRGILEELTNEVLASCAADALPRNLTADQVWIGAGGRVVLTDVPVRSGSNEESEASDLPVGGEERALVFLGDTAVLGLEGKPRRAGDPATTIQAPLPLGIRELLKELFVRGGDSTPDASARDRIQHFQASLQAAQSEPADVTRWHRARHLLEHGLCAGIGFTCIMAFLAVSFFLVQMAEESQFWILGWPERTAITVILLTLASVTFFLPAFLLRAGLSHLWAGIAVVTSDGRRASRLRCLCRALAAWAPIGFVVAIAVVSIQFISTPAAADEAAWLIFAAAGTVILGYLFMQLRNPVRAPHDYVTGTYLVPK